MSGSTDKKNRYKLVAIKLVTPGQQHLEKHCAFIYRHNHG
jgi:hypothetical protein